MNFELRVTRLAFQALVKELKMLLATLINYEFWIMRFTMTFYACYVPRLHQNIDVLLWMSHCPL